MSTKAERLTGENMDMSNGSDSQKTIDDQVERALSDETIPEHIPMTFKRLQALAALLALSAVAILPLFLISGGVAYTVADIGGNDSHTWLGLVNSLAVAVVAPVAGAVSDLVGRRYVGLTGVLLIIAGMIVVGTAHSMSVAIGGMALAGAGSGLAQTVGVAGACEIAPVKNRGAYLGTIYLFFILMAPASAYAQLYSTTATWRWGAWIPLALSGVAFVIVFVQYHPPPRVNSIGLEKKSVLSRIDYVGSFLWITGTGLFLTGLQFGGYNYDWNSVEVLTTLIIGGTLLFIAFPIWQIKSSSPMIPSCVFQNKRVTILALFIGAMGGAIFYTMAAFWQLEAQILFGPDPYAISRVVVSLGFAFLCGIFFIGWAITFSHGMINIVLLISSIIMTAGVGGVIAMTADNPHLGIGLSVLAGLGSGGIYIPIIVILTMVTPDEFIGLVTGLGLSIRFIGGAIGYSIFYNAFTNKLTAVLPNLVADAVVPAGLPVDEIAPLIGAFLAQNKTMLGAIKGITPAILIAGEGAVDEGFIQGFNMVYYVSLAFCGAAVVASLLIGDVRKYMTRRVAVDIH